MSRPQLAWLDITFDVPYDNLRFDEDLLAEGKTVLRVWECPVECVVLGRGGRPERDLYVDDCTQIGIPILWRCSGGGAVLLGPGCLNYTLVVPLDWDPKLRDVRYSLRWAMSRMRRALAVPDLREEGHCDLALNQRKVSGSAQRRTQTAILHHGTLLYNFDASRAERLLKPPVREPHYRAGRAHRDFLGNLPLTAGEIKQRLANAWCSPRADRIPDPVAPGSLKL
jgi:lipoate---protein ligase